MMRLTLYSFVCLCILSLSGVANPIFAQGTSPEYGKCGFYADSYHGRPTASGENYNKDALTCSHKTLAFNTKIRVTRTDNSKSVVVRVNDRGPHIEGYVTDVSGAAAKELDLVKAGSARVKIEVVESAQSASTNDATLAGATTQPANNQSKTSAATPTTASNTSPQTTEKKAAPSSSLFKVDIKESEKKGFGVQIASLKDANGVMPFMKDLQTNYPNKVLVNVIRDELNQSTYKIFVGPFPDKTSAETAQKTIAKKYQKTMIVDLSGL
jgi:rare lipoprotein A